MPKLEQNVASSVQASGSHLVARRQVTCQLRVGNKVLQSKTFNSGNTLAACLKFFKQSVRAGGNVVPNDGTWSASDEAPEAPKATRRARIVKPTKADSEPVTE